MQRLRAGLVAFAAGDALGLPFAGRAPRDISRDEVLAAPPAPGATGEATEALLAGPGPTLPGAVALGWGVSDPRERRRLAAGDAWAVAELAAMAIGGRPLHHAVRDHGEEWSPPFRGVAGPRATVSALLALVHRHDDPADAMRAAVRLGGQTALLAALAGAILGCRRPPAVARIPWLERVAVPPAPVLDALAAELAARRAGT